MRKHFSPRAAEKWSNFAPFLMRIVLGLIFLAHGWQKLTEFGLDGVAGFLDTLGVPAAGFFAFVITWLEILGGIALIIGFLTRWAAKLLTIEMIIALFTVHISAGFLNTGGGIEFILLILASLTTLMIVGPGKWALGKNH